MSAARQMVLITGVLPWGGHLGGWRHPAEFDKFAMNLDAFITLAKLAEKGKFHSVFLADGNAVRQMEKRALFENIAPSDRPASFEPATVMAALSQHTKHIGLFCTLSTTYNEPYNVARQLASLDHMSNGRAVWNVVTTSFEGDAVNYGNDPFPPREERYARGIEFVEVCKELWDSWAEDAFPQDKKTGKFLDADKVRKINHHGKHFDVEGPLNVARMPQGYPVLFMAGQSEPGREFAAKHAECLFVAAKEKGQGIAVRSDIRGRMAKYGRHPDSLKFIPGVQVNVAKTREEAYALNKQLASLVSPALGLEYLSSYMKVDMAAYDPDGPFPSDLPDVEGWRSHRDAIVEIALRDKLTVRQTWEKLIGGSDHEPFTGTAEEVADQLEEWFVDGACDGFMIGAPTVLQGLTNIVELLIPELQRRGLFHKDYIGGTTREEMGVPIPANPYFERQAAE